jgi:hypothetical protein
MCHSPQAPLCLDWLSGGHDEVFLLIEIVKTVYLRLGEINAEFTDG